MIPEGAALSVGPFTTIPVLGLLSLWRLWGCRHRGLWGAPPLFCWCFKVKPDSSFYFFLSDKRTFQKFAENSHVIYFKLCIREPWLPPTGSPPWLTSRSWTLYWTQVVPMGGRKPSAWAVTSASRVCVGPGVRHQRRDSNPVSAGQHAGVLATCRAPASLWTFGVLLYVRKQVRVVGDVQNVSIFWMLSWLWLVSFVLNAVHFGQVFGGLY